MAFTTAVGAPDVVVHPVPLPVIDLCDLSTPHVGMMLTTPTVIHDATVVDGAIRIQRKHRPVLARRSFDRQGRRVWVGNGVGDGRVVSCVCTGADVAGVGRARHTADAPRETAIPERLDVSVPSALYASRAAVIHIQRKPDTDSEL